MFSSMKKRVDNPVDDIETIIGRNTTITGQIGGDGNIRIDGRVDGGITITGDAIIGETGIVIGDVKAGNLMVSGSITGNAEIEGNLSIQEAGQLIGDVKVRSLNIADGGIFKGRSEMAVRDGSYEPEPVL